MLDTLICGAITWTACIVGIAAALGWRRSLREQRRLKKWADAWRKDAANYALELHRIRESRRRVGKTGRASQLAIAEARKAQTTAQLRAEIGA
jgi:hypothetical protein